MSFLISGHFKKVISKFITFNMSIAMLLNVSYGFCKSLSTVLQFRSPNVLDWYPIVRVLTTRVSEVKVAPFVSIYGT